MWRKPANVFVAGFIGTPSMNLFSASCRSEGGGTAALEGPNVQVVFSGDKGKRLQQYVGQDVVVGIRPNNIHDLSLSNGGGIGGGSRLGKRNGN